MRLRCVYNLGLENQITQGKVYEIVGNYIKYDGEELVRIKNDKGNFAYYYLHRFSPATKPLSRLEDLL